MPSILGLVFSSTHSKELFEIAKGRTIASVPIGGRYRLIDFTLSNMVNFDISHIGIVTKSNYQSLMDHVGSGKSWDLARKNGGLIILPPYGNSVDLFNSRLEALKSIIQFINEAVEEYVVLTDCYHICNIDYEPIFKQHIETEADITCVYRESFVTEGDYTPIKSFTLDENKRIMEMNIIDSYIGNANQSLDIWIMKREFLQELVLDSINNNLKSFNRDILFQNLHNYKIYGYKFPGFFKDINSIKSYYDANMMLLNPKVRDELFNKENHAIYTRVRDSAPTRYGNDAYIINSLIADGCMIDGTVINCIIFRGTRIEKGSIVTNSILMQDTIIDTNINVDCVITDKNVHIINQKDLNGTKNNPIYIERNEVV